MKAHLIAYPGPAPEFADYESLCGQTVKSAKYVIELDIPASCQNWADFFNPITTCPKCIDVLKRLSENPPEELKTCKRWHIYGIANRDELEKSKSWKWRAGALEGSA